jgi:hypothetical protein
MRPANGSTQVGGGTFVYGRGMVSSGEEDDSSINEHGDYLGNDDFNGNADGHSNGNNYNDVDDVRKDAPSFYGITLARARACAVYKKLRFQDREFGLGRYPSATAGHRLNMERYLKEIDATHLRSPTAEIRKILDDSSWGARAALDGDAAIRKHWLQPNGYYIQKGFPLVEDVDFIVVNNRALPEGDCYWRSMSFHLYGSDAHWDLIKAEHLAYVHYVLTHPEHPRYSLYKETLNQKFVETASITASFIANLWQVLHLAHAWTPALMQQVTADLYNVCLITFTRDSGCITETAVRGSHNSRHMFLLFVEGNHFQPMCPNEYPSSEFRYPRVTTTATAQYSNAPKGTSRKSTMEHPWRNDFTASVPAPVPRLHGCDVDKLRRYLGSNPTS